MPVDSPEIRNEAQIVNLDSRTKRFVERKFGIIPLRCSAVGAFWLAACYTFAECAQALDCDIDVCAPLGCLIAEKGKVLHEREKQSGCAGLA